MHLTCLSSMSCLIRCSVTIKYHFWPIFKIKHCYNVTQIFNYKRKSRINYIVSSYMTSFISFHSKAKCYSPLYLFCLSVLFFIFSRSDTRLICLTGVAFSGYTDNVIMTFDGAERTSLAKYEYKDNPEITAVYPSEAFNAYV